MIEDLGKGEAGSWPESLTAFDGGAVFAASRGDLGRELWRTDASPGVELILDVRPGKASSTPAGLTRLGAEVFFSADDGLHGRELWKTDGTAAGTVLVKNIGPTGAHGNPQDLIAVGGILYFTADDGAGRELWRIDGIAQGTYLRQGHGERQAICALTYATASAPDHLKVPGEHPGKATSQQNPGVAGSTPALSTS